MSLVPVSTWCPIRLIIIPVIVLGSAIFLKPSRFKKFFFIYALTIGTTGILVYQGNTYMGERSATRMLPSQIELTDFRLDTPLEIFLKGTITNTSSNASVKEVRLRFTLYADEPGTDVTRTVLGTRDIKRFMKIGPGEHGEIFEKPALEQIDPSRTRQGDVAVISVRAALL